MIQTLRAAAAHAKPRLSNLLRLNLPAHVPSTNVRPSDVFSMMHVAYFASVYNKSPHPLHVMYSLARTYIYTNQMKPVFFLLRQMTLAPSVGVCEPSSPQLCDALGSLILLLHKRVAYSKDRGLGKRKKGSLPYKLANLYDACTAAQIPLPCPALSALIARLSKHLHGTALLRFIRIVISDFMKRPPTDYTSSVIASIVIAYGRASAPHKGDSFLRDYALRHGGMYCIRMLASQFQRSHLSWLRRFTNPSHIPLDVPLHNAWSSHTVVWSAIIRAYTLNGDLVRSRIWLERFRVTQQLAPKLKSMDLKPPQNTASPYHTFVHGVSSFEGIRAYSASISRSEKLRHEIQAERLKVSFKAAVVYDVIDAMRGDGVVMGVSLLNFLTSFEAGFAHLQRSKSLALESLSMKRGPGSVAQRVQRPRTRRKSMHGKRMHVATVTSVCNLYATDAFHHMSPTSLMPLDRKLFQTVPGVDIVTVRGVLSHCVELATKSSSQQYIATKGQSLLNAMLRAMLWTNDFPGAWYTVQLFAKWRVEPNAFTYLVLWQRFSPIISGLSIPHSMKVVQELLLHMLDEQVKALGTVALDEPAWAAELCQNPNVDSALSRIERDAHARL